MPDKQDPLFEVEDSQEDLGKIEISPSVIEVIAAIAASEVAGVVDRRGNSATGAVEKLGGRKLRRGIKADLTPEGIVIHVRLIMKFGVSVPDVAEGVQDNIVRTLKKMTALDVYQVNVHVVGVVFDQDEKKDEDMPI